MTGTRVRTLSKPADLVGLHAADPRRYPFLLESASGPSAATSQGRYDLLFAFPGASIELAADGTLGAAGFVPETDNFLDNLDRWFKIEAEAEQAPELPFSGGWFLYLGYEFSGLIEPVLKLPPTPAGMPMALAVRCPAVVIHDHVRNSTLLAAEAGHDDKLSLMAEDIANLPVQSRTTDLPLNAEVQEEPPEHFLQSLGRIHEYIRAGDVYQVNLSRRWQVGLQRDVDAVTLYRRLRQVNPAPFSGLMVWNETAVLSSSPERLVQCRDGIVETRPIAGTHPRVDSEAGDRLQARALLGHPKERAEHVMLLDLERNDLGRICEPGSVRVNELMTLETYAHVHHIVSNVQGRLLEGVLPGAVIRAVFPGGTITGCPKIRCMQIIAELENEGRGAYTGAMGYLDRSGALDLNILIRSLVMRGRKCVFRTGAGIVADSNPQRELEETRAKAMGLLRLFGTGP